MVIYLNDKEEPMYPSILLAKIFGLYFFILGIALIFKKDYFRKAYDEVLTHKGDTILLACVTLILGILLVLSHGHFSLNWSFLVSLMSWIIFIKGILLFWFPEKLLKIKQDVVKHDGLYYTATVVFLLLGIYFIWFGFFWM